MGAPLSTYNFAVASTDTGHKGSSGDGTFAIDAPETQVSFTHHLGASHNPHVLMTLSIATDRFWPSRSTLDDCLRKDPRKSVLFQALKV